MINGIEINYTETVTVKRLQASSEPDVEEYGNHLTGVACHIQPFDDSYTEDITGSFGKDWLMFADYADILEGDKIINGSVEYKVISVERFEFLGQTRHMEMRIRLFNA